jgi:hypothetical protein
MRWFVLFTPLVFATCTEIPEPSYISISAIELKNSGLGENSTSAFIQDAWVYIDDNLVGAFELPCKIPVSQDGQHKITVGAGIWVNTLPTLRSPYVFYRFYEMDAELQSGQTISLNPVVQYNENVKFAYQAGFDSPTGNTLESTLQSDTTGRITNQPNLVFEGQGSFQASLLREQGYVEFQQAEPVQLPKSGAFVFLELNYTSSHTLNIGVRSFYPAAGNVYTQVAALPATPNWQKAYINLTSAVSTEVNSQSQRAVFSVTKLSGSGELDLRIDNIRIIHFKP